MKKNIKEIYKEINRVEREYIKLLNRAKSEIDRKKRPHRVYFFALKVRASAFNAI